MYDVSEDFINNVQQSGREIAVRISFDSVVLSGDDVFKIDKQLDADFFRSSMQQIEGEIRGRYDLKDKTIKVEFGVSYDGSLYEYADFGDYVVVDHLRIVGETSNEDKTTFKAYDMMVKSHAYYDVAQLGVVYPITVFNLFTAIANLMGLTVENTSITNGDIIINEDLYSNIDNVTYRNILDDIAQTSGSSIIIHEGKLLAKYLTTNVATIYEDNMRLLKLKKEYGAVNILNLTREPQHDNYVYPENFETIPVNDRVEIVMADNQIMDKSREVFAPALFTQISGLSYYPFESETVGLAFLEGLDSIEIVDMNSVSHTSVIMHSRLVITSGVKETLSSEVPMYSKEEFALVTDTRRANSRVYFLVDQQNLLIESSVSRIDGDLSLLSTQLLQTAENIIQQVAENYATTGQLGSVESSLINQIISNANETLQTFTEFEQTIELVDGKYVTKFNELETYVRTSIDGLELGETNSPFKLKISKNRISFLENNNEVAYISNSTLNITDGAFFTSLRIGNFEWKAEEDGSISFGKVV